MVKLAGNVALQSRHPVFKIDATLHSSSDLNMCTYIKIKKRAFNPLNFFSYPSMLFPFFNGVFRHQ